MGGHVAGEATREAPAQAEYPYLRRRFPQSAGPFGAYDRYLGPYLC
jgi:hypothetical protein